jgi:hypothetical protein
VGKAAFCTVIFWGCVCDGALPILNVLLLIFSAIGVSYNFQKEAASRQFLNEVYVGNFERFVKC